MLDEFSQATLQPPSSRNSYKDSHINSLILFFKIQQFQLRLEAKFANYSLTVNIFTLLVNGIKKGACFNMSCALVPSITACQRKLRSEQTSCTKRIDTWNLKLQLRSYYLRNKIVIYTISMKVTGGSKLPSIVPILQL